MKAVVVDLELTQPNCKIIQIGAVLVNLKAQKVIDVFDIVCNPDELPNEFIEQLTGITKQDVSDGVPLNEALQSFWAWLEEAKCGNRLYEWGSGDSRCLIQQSNELNVEMTKRPKIFDVKEMSGMFRQCFNAKSRGGLGNTINLLGMDFIGTPHNALADALNTARVLFRFQQMIQTIANIEKQYGTPQTILNEKESNEVFWGQSDKFSDPTRRMKR